MLALGLAVGFSQSAASHDPAPANPAQMDGKELVTVVVAHENEATGLRGYYTFLSVERGDRTGGHEWTERVAETTWGRVRYLIAVDGKTLTGQQLAAEKARVEEEGAHPEAFRQQEAKQTQDELRARAMLQLLPKAFFFDPPQAEGDYLRVRYYPNPSYQPNGIDERVLHAMTGSVLIDPKLLRAREITARLPQDVNLGLGLASVRAGSNFSTVRGHMEGYDWKTLTSHTDFNVKALFVKTIARHSDSVHSDFKLIPSDMTVASAVTMLEKYNK
jgi:hypothetical protein